MRSPGREGPAEEREPGWSRVERAVLFAILTFPLLHHSGLPLEVYLLLNGALVVLWLRRTRLLRDDSWRGWPWDLLVALCGAWMAVATVANLHHVSQALLAWESGALLAIYARRNYERFFGHRFLLAFAATVLAFETLVCLAQYYALAGTSAAQMALAQILGVDDPTRFGVGGGGARVSRAVGTFLHANTLGGWIAMLLPLALSGFQTARRDGRAVPSSAWLALVLLSFTILLRTFARLAVLAGAAGVAASLLGQWLRSGAGVRPRPSVPRVVVVIPIALAIAIGYATLGASGARGLSGIVQAKIADGRNETLVRLVLMRGALSALAERPLGGWGYPMGDQGMPDLGAVARQISPEMERKYQRVSDAKVHVHNLFLIVALNGGLPALLFFLGALLWVCIEAAARARRLSPEEVSIAAGIIAYLVMSLGYTVVHDQLWPLFLFLLGSLKAAASRHRPDDDRRAATAPR